MTKLILLLLLIPFTTLASGYHKGQKGETGTQGQPGIQGIPGQQGEQGRPGYSGQPGADSAYLYSAIQHHFSPKINDWQGSISGASDFDGNNALSLSIGKVICTECGNKILLHGNGVTNGDEGALGIGATFTWK